jgi:hypothetical protein
LIAQCSTVLSVVTLVTRLAPNAAKRTDPWACANGTCGFSDPAATCHNFAIGDVNWATLIVFGVDFFGSNKLLAADR